MRESPSAQSPVQMADPPPEPLQNTVTEKAVVSLPQPQPDASYVPRTVDFGFLPIPRYCRYSPDKSFDFTYGHAAIFAFASSFSMNLYYCQPILVTLEKNFSVDEVGISKVPTLLQAGYAVGLLFLTPLGDLVRRRQMLFLLMLTSASLSIALAITHSLVTFEIVSFFVAVSSVTPQVIIPLVAELAPAKRRSTFIAIAFSGLLVGVMLARVLSGIIAESSTYRNVYWMGVAGQYLLLLVLYFICPDLPPKNAHLSYWQILYTTGKLAVTQPLLIQSSIIILLESVVFACFWVTLTYLLSSPVYHLNTLQIGLFALVGLLGISCSPFVGRAIDSLVTWTAALSAILLILVSQAIYTGAGGLSLGAVVVVIFVLDVGVSGLQVALSTQVFAIDPNARARLNAVLVLSIFIGQVIGTSAGTKIYVRGGYRFTGTFSLCISALMLIFLLVRGPHVPYAKWLGWQGGSRLTKRREKEGKA